ncbi:MAG: hypothetical protein R3C60_01800 [Parvularculaceae bacterium]
MKLRNAIRLASTALLLSLETLSPAAATGTTDIPPGVNSRSGLIAALSAAGPHSSLSDQANIVGRLVGAWDVKYTQFSKDGTAKLSTGQFIAGWIMDGRAIQILWIVDPSKTRTEREVYTNVDWFDQKAQTWRSAFVDPEHGSLAKFAGGPEGDDRFVLETEDFGSELVRWSANNIQANSFVWREEASTDGGTTWRLEAEYQMKRRGASFAR